MPDAGITTATMSSQVSPYPPQTDGDRDALIGFARQAPLTYGSWNRFKSLYKAVESDPNAAPQLLGTLLARIDDAPISLGNKDPRVAFADSRNVNTLAVSGEHLFVLNGRYYWGDKSLIVYESNPVNPLQPIPGATFNLSDMPGYVLSAALCGSFYCLVINDRGEDSVLHIIDVSQPKNPRRRGKLSLKGNVALAVDPRTPTLLYVRFVEAQGNGSQGLRIVSLSNPDTPRLVGAVTVKGLVAEPGNLAIDDGIAALIAKPVGFSWRNLPQAGGLRLVDVSDPTNPRSLGSLDLTTPLCVARRGQFVYVGVGSNNADQTGLQIVDVHDPRNPRKSGFVKLGGFVTGISISQDGLYVYARTQNGTIYTVNVGYASAPVLSSTTDRLYGDTEMTIAGNLAYTSGSYSGVALLSLVDPAKPVRIGAPPTGDTIGYMKRRGRRFLRMLSQSDPARYAEVATEMLLGLAGKDAVIDPTRHWATIDTLYGGGSRFRQTKHGRGRYIGTGTVPSKLALRTREDRAPAAWNARPDLLARLLNATDLFAPVQTFAARALRAAGQPLPAISEGVLEQWLVSSEPLLIALAVRAVTERLRKNEALSPTVAAEAFFKAGASVRRILAEERAGTWASKRTWAEPFALRLAALTQPAISTQIQLSKRQTDSAVLLARYFAWAIVATPQSLLPLVAPFVASGRRDLQSLIVAGAGQATPERLVAWLTELGRVPDASQREPVIAALISALSGVALDRSVIRRMVYSPEPFVREGGWRLIAASATPSDVLNPLWTELLQSRDATPALTTAMASPDALGLLERAGIGSVELAMHVAERPFLVELLSPEAFSRVAATAPPAVVLSLVAASPDDHWQRLRPVWLQQLRDGIGTAAIWLAAEHALDTDNTDRLAARLLGDAEIAATLLSVEDEKVLEIREPAFGAILGQWVRYHVDRFTKNSSLLFDAATHPLPEVRVPSLERVTVLGMDMPFALRLVESAVPPSMAVGRSFFEGEPIGGDRVFDYALALCDSYSAEVRAIGIDYVTERWETIPQERVLSALFENPAPEIQAFVAAQLGANATDRPIATPIFDAEVLRTTNRARVAKERIKTRQSAEPTVDTQTLLTLARGRTPRDAEWALRELARRATSGESIAGITVEGIVGI